MYLSSLLIDVGDNPDRPRPGRLWLRNVYRVHQRLCMAFPSKTKLLEDGDFLRPFRAEDFACNQVHVRRGSHAGFLFRIDPQLGGRAVILVQSALEPDWGYAFHNAGHLLAAPPELRPFAPHFAEGEALRFRLLANPTRKISTKSDLGGRRNNGKRVPVFAHRLLDWLAQRAERAGFALEPNSVALQAGFVYVGKAGDDGGKRLRSARYDGTLRVTNVSRFGEALTGGIGPAKGYGFGLLSVAKL